MSDSVRRCIFPLPSEDELEFLEQRHHTLLFRGRTREAGENWRRRLRAAGRRRRWKGLRTGRSEEQLLCWAFIETEWTEDDERRMHDKFRELSPIFDAELRG